MIEDTDSLCRIARPKLWPKHALVDHWLAVKGPVWTNLDKFGSSLDQFCHRSVR